MEAAPKSVRQLRRNGHCVWTVALIIGLLWPVVSGIPANAAMSGQTFTDKVASRLREQLPDATVVVQEPLGIQFRTSDGTQIVVNLYNAYREYLANPEAVDAIVTNWASNAVEIAAGEQPLSIDKILPVIKNQKWLELQAGRFPPSSPGDLRTLYSEPLIANLVLVYAADSDRRVQYYREEDIKALHLSPGALRAKSLDNLRLKLPALTITDMQSWKGVEIDQVYETSLFLMDDVWTDPRFRVDGDPIVGIPARGYLIFTGSKDSTGVAQVRRVAKEIASTNSYPLTDQLFIRRNGKFELYDP